MEWLPFFDTFDPWQVFVGLLVLILGPYALLSEKVVKEKFGAVGMFFRWISGQKRRRMEEKQTVAERQINELREEIKRVDVARKRDNARLKAQVTRLETMTEKQHSYILWITDVFRGVELWAAEKGYTLPPPPFKTYTEWVKEKEEEEEGGE